jgi:hypothetical protein
MPFMGISGGILRGIQILARTVATHAVQRAKNHRSYQGPQRGTIMRFVVVLPVAA